MRSGQRLVVLVVLALLALPLALPAAAGVEPGEGPLVLRDGDAEVSPATRQWLDQVGSVRVGWTGVLAPVSVVEDGAVNGGYAVDAWDLAALRLGLEVDHVPYPDAAALGAALRSGEIDVVGALGFHPSVAELEPSRPLAWVPVVLVGRAEQAALGAADLTGRSISSLPGARVREQVDEAHPGATYVPTENAVLGLQAVADGDIDLFFGPLALLGYQIARLDLDLVPVGEPGALSTVQAWTLPASDASRLVTTVRDSLSDSDLALLHRRWTGFDLTDPAAAVTPGWLAPVVTALAVVLGVAIGFVVLFRARVRRATVELRDVNEHLEETVHDRTAELAATAARLRRSNQALKRFTSTAAHDLKGPLTAIAGLADVAIRLDLSEQQEEDILERVRGSAQRLGRMVDDMLEDAVNMGAATVTLTGREFADWLREVTAPELDVIAGRLEVDVPDGLVAVDVEVLRRAAINLVGNACKYAVNEQGVLVQVRLVRDGAVWNLEVDDNGPGIPRALWSDVFDRGSRLSHDDDRGFGLGLAATRDLVQGAGGSIRLGDAALGGAAFTVTLPTVEVPAIPGDADDDADRAPAGTAGG